MTLYPIWVGCTLVMRVLCAKFHAKNVERSFPTVRNAASNCPWILQPWELDFCAMALNRGCGSSLLDGGFSQQSNKFMASSLAKPPASSARIFQLSLRSLGCWPAVAGDPTRAHWLGKWVPLSGWSLHKHGTWEMHLELVGGLIVRFYFPNIWNGWVID